MRTEAQIQASRRNGAKSHGPATPEGKAASSQNAYKHGFYARHLQLLPDEEPIFEDLFETYTQHYQPVTPYEHHLVGQCVISAYQFARAQTIQIALVNIQLAASRAEIEQTFQVADHATILAAGYHLLNDRSTSFRNMDSHQSRLLRQLARFQAMLADARKLRPSQPSPSLPDATPGLPTKENPGNEPENAAAPDLPGLDQERAA